MRTHNRGSGGVSSRTKAYEHHDGYQDSHTVVSALQSRCAVAWRLGIRIMNATFDEYLKLW